MKLNRKFYVIVVIIIIIRNDKKYIFSFFKNFDLVFTKKNFMFFLSI